MAWATPTITIRRGRYIRHTYITVVGTLNGTTGISIDLADMPLAIFAGTIQAVAALQTNDDVTTLAVRAGVILVGNNADNNLYNNALTISGDPDFFPIASIFEQIAAPSNANFMGAITLPSNEIRLIALSDNAAETNGTVTVHIGLLSHILEV